MQLHQIVLIMLMAAIVAAAPLHWKEKSESSTFVILADFDPASNTSRPWKLVNDPVMGGVSGSTFQIDSQAKLMTWTGVVDIVPSLQAPGFCNLETKNEFSSHFPSAAGTDGLLLRVRSSTPEYSGFKVSFAAKTIDPQFKSFKASFRIDAAPNEWTTVSLPWDAFSNDWSPATGDCNTTEASGRQRHCCSASHPEVCPKPDDLPRIQALGLWTEGHAGNFSLDIDWIAAGSLQKATTMQRVNSTCKGPLQRHLRYNASDRLAVRYLPFPPTTPLETLAEAICCDVDLEGFAEPANFYARPDVNLFGAMNTSGVTTFYDPVCGLPLFMAPMNRTLADFQADTAEHTWPSFRAAEVISANIVVHSDNRVFSTCGTHLGDYAPDAKGPRYCLDLVCVSGNPA
mmetsp:Transcript_145484/g.451270  ORF Transcript_145484/g.451270 Transcript_145484/m.451270 type:complete len:400 (+) Transcript_145484:122-1321(+)